VDPYADNGAPPIFLLHGFLMTSAIWQDNISGILEFGRPFCFELMAHGRSPAPSSDAAYSIPAYVSCIDRVRVLFGYEKVFLCAHSLGGAFALSYALAYPERTSGVVFTNSKAALRDTTPSPGGSAPDKGFELTEALSREQLEQSNAHPLKLRHVSKSLRETLIAEAKTIDLAGIARCFETAVLRASVRDRIAELNVPALLINGKLEADFQPLRDWAGSNIPNLEIADVDAGHSVNAQAPSEFNSLLRKFVEANS
jgi:pimeloyl-ACP methyl ester carboxylesterase